MDSQAILELIKEWAGVAALPLAALALRLNFLRYKASVADKQPDIRLLQITKHPSKYGDYFSVRYEIKNRSDKNLHLIDLQVEGLGKVAYSGKSERDGYGQPIGPGPFDPSNDSLNCQTHLHPSGSQRGASGFGGDGTYGDLKFQPKKQNGRVTIKFIYAFSSEDEKREKKAFKRRLP